MLSYRHAFHAGNFADVHKHVILALLLQSLRAKPKPFCCYDTHAGAGVYDLTEQAAQKTGEFHGGIERLWPITGAESLGGYLDAVRALNPDGSLHYYPGSPGIARHFLRAADRMVLMELHPADHAALRQNFRNDKRVAVHRRDGFEGLPALVPPQEKRGLVLIDPPYEVKADYGAVVPAVREAHKRWPGGIYAVWYPVLAGNPAQRLLDDLKKSGLRNVLRSEFYIAPPDTPLGLNGSGMVIVNPPWQIDACIAAAVAEMEKRLDTDEAPAPLLDWWIPE
ncbi:MAG: 23S rRNA (adenine(2030)-N(6))-methyltransferase RlmJ [Gammaproteobacteria bacterium]